MKKNMTSSLETLTQKTPDIVTSTNLEGFGELSMCYKGVFIKKVTNTKDYMDHALINLINNKKIVMLINGK